MKTQDATPLPSVEFDNLLENLDLPMLPETVASLLQLCRDPNCGADQIATAIRSDASLAGHVLELANSPRFGVGTKIASLSQCVARLGNARIRELALVISCRERIFKVPSYEADVRSSFENSLRVAVIAQEIARWLRLNVEDSFLCGLLHDVGRPVILQALVDYQDQYHVAYEREEVLRMADQFRFLVSGELAKEWKLPDRIVSTITQQDTDDLLSLSTEASILKLATILATVDHEQPLNMEDLHCNELIESLNLYPDEIDSILQLSRDETQ